MTWKHQLSIIVNERGEQVVCPNWWAKTFGIAEEEVVAERDRLIAEREAIELLRARREAEDLGQ